MLRTISAALAVTACCASLATSASAQDTPLNVDPLNPIRVAEDGGDVLIGTVPVPGHSTAGLFRVRGASDALEVLRPHAWSSLGFHLPSVWFRVDGDGALVGTDGQSLWRLDAAGPERRVTLLEEADLFNTAPVGQARGIVYFSPLTSTRGAELWRTDGTAEGTWLVRDIEPGRRSSFPRFGETVGSVVFFAAETTEHGRELWRTDGTAEGTVRVADLRPGPESSNPVMLGRLGGELLFVTHAAGGGSELWRSDGSREGTRAVGTIDAGVEDRARRGRLGDVLTFEAREPSGLAQALWRTDGTAEGTFRLLPDASSGAHVVARGRLWFAAAGTPEARGLWLSDGTREGTRRLWELPDAADRTTIIDIAALGDGVAFRARRKSGLGSLWFTDGTTEETTLLAGAEIGSSIPNTYYFGMLATTGDAAWFAAYGGAGGQLWTTDGTVEGTYPVSLAGITDEPEHAAPSPLEPFADAGPVGPEPAPPSEEPTPDPPEPLDVQKLRIDLRLGGEVDLRLRCRVPLAGDRDVLGETVMVDVAGIVTEVVLDRRGRASTSDGRRVRARVRRGRGNDPDTVRLDLRLRHAPVGPALLDEGLSVPPGEPLVDRPVYVEVRWRDVVHTAEPTVRYRQRPKRGIAKLLE